MFPPAGLFEALPNELLLQIIFLLPVRDVLSLQYATKDTLRVLNDRIDPSLYMQSRSPFRDSKRLLEGLGTHGAVLSGSRALEYFVPGSCNGSSDWDFYVPPVLMSVDAVKKALEASGVVFESTLETAVKMMQRGLPVMLGQRPMVSIAYEVSFESRAWSDEENLVIKGIHEKYPVLQDMSHHIHADGSTRWIEDLEPIVLKACGSVESPQQHDSSESTYPEDVSGRVLSGTIQIEGETSAVQLIVGNMDPRKTSLADPLSKTVFRNIFAFYGSHVQCFLTKHVALHMYYNLAVCKMAYRWQVPATIRERAERAVQKYTSRGFEFFTAPENSQHTHRSPQDVESCLIELNSGSNYSPSLSQIKDLRWNHRGDAIRQELPSGAIDARKEMLRFGIQSMA